jgi:hypothetical protein
MPKDPRRWDQRTDQNARSNERALLAQDPQHAPHIQPLLGQLSALLVAWHADNALSREAGHVLFNEIVTGTTKE